MEEPELKIIHKDKWPMPPYSATFLHRPTQLEHGGSHMEDSKMIDTAKG